MKGSVIKYFRAKRLAFIIEKRLNELESRLIKTKQLKTA